MFMDHRTAGALFILLALPRITAAAPDTYLPWEGGASYYAKWPGGPPSDPNFFPVTVWLQDPSTARDYKAIGINLFVGLWKGPTEEQLKVLAESDMPVLAGFRESIRAAPNSNLIRGWTFMDEPDNAQPKAGGGWGPCVLPPVIIDRYRNLKSRDDTKPVYLNLGQGVVNEKWVGRGEVCRMPGFFVPYCCKIGLVSPVLTYRKGVSQCLTLAFVAEHSEG